MKFLAYLAALASVAYAQQGWCPITSGSCNPSNVPTAPKTAKLVQSYISEGFKCTGTIEIVNECQFTVKNFQVLAPGATKLEWYGAEEFNSKNGGNCLSSVSAVQSVAPSDITVDTGDNQFCRASLVDHVGSISLMDDQYRVICHAELGGVTKTAGAAGASTGAAAGKTGAAGAAAGAAGASAAGASAAGKTGSTASAAGASSSTLSGTTKAGNSTSSTTTTTTSGANTLMVPSALYVALLSVFLYLRN